MKVCCRLHQHAFVTFGRCRVSSIVYIVAVIVVGFAATASGRPQRQLRPANDDAKNVALPSPARSAPSLYAAPIFDVFGGLFAPQPAEKKETVQSTTPRPTLTTTKGPASSFKPSLRDPVSSSAGPARLQPQTATIRDQTEEETGDGDDDYYDDYDEDYSDYDRPPSVLDNLINLPLPVFNKPETILSATEELRSLDPNQLQFIPVAGTNAGVLPLTGEAVGALNLFPPLRPAIRLPN